MSVLTGGDSVDGYRMAGIPDGLGAFKSNKGNFTLLMNQELPSIRVRCGNTAVLARSSRAGPPTAPTCR